MIGASDPPGIPSWRYRVTVDGTPVPGVTGWECSATLGDPVGASVIRSGRGDATGTVEVRPRVVSDGVRALDGDGVWPPAAGATVTIETSPDGVSWVPACTLPVDEPDASTDGSSSAKLIGPWDQLARPFSQGPLLSTMPAAPDQGSNVRRVGVHLAWWLERLLFEAGFTVSGYRRSVGAETLVAASLMGSVWPRQGLVVSSDSNAAAAVSGVAWGYTIPDVNVTYRSRLDPYAEETTIETQANDSQLVFLVDKTHTERADIILGRADNAPGDVDVVIGANRAVQVFHGSTLVVSLSPAQVGTLVTLTRYGQSWYLTSTTATGVNQSTAVSPVGAGWNELTVSSAPGSRIGGVEWTTYPGTHPKVHQWAPSAIIVPGPTLTYLNASPRVESSSVGAVLEQILTATMCSLMVDERGRVVVLPWASTGVNATVPTLTTSRDVLGELRRSWSLRDLASGVEVKQRVPSSTLRGTYTEQVWQGSGDDLGANSPEETWIDVPADEEWVGVDLSLTRAEANTVGPGTLGGGSRVLANDADGDPILVSVGGNYSGGITRVSHGTYKITERSAVSMTRKAPPLKAWGAWQNRALPVVRSYSKVKWIDQTTAQAFALADRDPRRYAASFTLDAGAWLRADHATRTVDLLMAAMADAPMLLSDLEIFPDPRIQLGDTVVVSSPRQGLDLSCIVVRKDMSASEGGALSMVLTVAVTAQRAAPQTYAGLDATSTTYSALDAPGGAYGTLTRGA